MASISSWLEIVLAVAAAFRPGLFDHAAGDPVEFGFAQGYTFNSTIRHFSRKPFNYCNTIRMQAGAFPVLF